MKKIFFFLLLSLKGFCLNHALLDHLKQLLPELDAQDLEILPLSGGKSEAEIYRLRHTKVDYVLRKLNTSRRQALKEFKAIELASSIGLAPKAHLFLDKPALLIMDFNPSQRSQPSLAKNRSFLKNMASSIKKLQTLQLDNQDELIDKTTLIANHLKARDLLTGQMLTIYETLQQMGSHKEERVFSHGDLSPCNIFHSPMIQFIDFSEAGLGDPFFDLVYFSFFHVLSEDDSTYLLECYLGHAPQNQDINHFMNVKKALLGHFALEFFLLSKILKKNFTQAIDYKNSKLLDLVLKLVDPSHDMTSEFCENFTQKLTIEFFNL